MPENRFTSRYDFFRRRAGISSRTSLRLRAAFTLTELLVTMLIVVIIVSAFGIVLVGGVRGWKLTYDRANSDVVADSYAARMAFDAVVRRSSRRHSDVDVDAGKWLEVYYYEGYQNIPCVGNYARFEWDKQTSELRVVYGELLPEKKAVRTKILCTNVDDCVFMTDYRSAQMILELYNGSQRVTVVSSAVMHNRG